MPDNVRELVVTDVRIPFWSMVVLLGKWSLAAIPAMIILIAVGAVLSMTLGTFFDGTFAWHGKA